MKRITTVALIMFSFVFVQGQVKPKTSPQPSKPSKQTTIKYLNDKLNENCIGRYGGSVDERMDPTCNLQNVFICDNLEIKDENNIPYLVITLRYEVRKYCASSSDGEDYDHFYNCITKIPVLKIKDIIYANTPDKVDRINTNHKITQLAFSGVIITTYGNYVQFSQLDKQTTDHLAFQQLPFSNSEEVEKLKKAILNLKTYYKTSSDPFDN